MASLCSILICTLSRLASILRRVSGQMGFFQPVLAAAGVCEGASQHQVFPNHGWPVYSRHCFEAFLFQLHLGQASVLHSTLKSIQLPHTWGSQG